MRNKRKTSKYLWCTLMIAVIAACATFIYIRITTGTKNEPTYQTSNDYFSSPEKLAEEKCVSVCETKECIYQSKVLLDSINPDVNPCEDFYHFACGRNFEKVDEYESYNIDDRLGNVLFRKVKHLLDGIEAETGRASEKLKAVYDSCMEYSSNEFQAVPTVLKLLDNLGIPNWPNLASDFSFTNNIPKVIANFLLYNEYVFIEFSTKDGYFWMKDNFTFDGKVNASLRWTKSFYETQDKPTRKYLVNRILNYFKLDDETVNGIWEELEAIHDAVTNLKQESEKIDEEIENMIPPFLYCGQGTEEEWENLCESLKSLIEIAGATDKVNEDFASMYNDYEVYFMRNIFPLLRNFTDRSVGNYLAINVFLNNLNDLPPYFHLSRKKEERNFSRMRPPSLKWKKCVQWITKHMTIALGHEYLKKGFTLSMIRDVQDLGKECIKESSDLIMRQDWIKNDTYRQSVKKRIDGIKFEFDNYFEMLPNETRVNDFYKLIQYHPTDDSFLHNVFEHKKSMKIIELKGLFQTYESEWIWYLFMVEAFGGGGQIDLFFGVMLPPLYVPGGERIMNMLTLGFVIIHEVGHELQEILDNDIRHFDSEGIENYQKKMKCIEDQYSEFQLDSIGKNLNGSKYLRENFGDTVSISVLDKLIEKYVSQNTTRLLPSLAYSLRQQMYVYAAQVWCSVSNKESDEYYYSKQTHTPDKFRLLGKMQNSKGFSEAFGCPAGSYLNPVTKCTLFR